MSTNDIDPFLLEVLKNGLDTIADEMALVTMKTAYSGIVRELDGFLDRGLRRGRPNACAGSHDRDASR